MHANDKQTHYTYSIQDSLLKEFMSNFEFLTMVETGKDIII